MVDAAAERVDAVAGSNRLLAGDHRRPHSRRPHRLTPPRNPYGWLWLGFGLGLAIQSLAMSYEAYALVVEPGSLAAPRTISHVLELGGQVALTLAPLLMLLFPTGRLPSRRWRPLAWISTTAGAVLLLLVLLFENPDQVGGVISITTFAVVYVIFTAILLSALSIVVRYRGRAEQSANS